MTAFMDNLGVFLLAVIGFVTALLIFVYVKTGSWSGFVAHWKTTGDGSAAGIVKAILAVLLFAILAFGFNSLHAETRWLEYTAIYAGIDATSEVSPMCTQSRVDDRLTSNIGVRQSIVRVKDVSLLGNYTHHSCAVGIDNRGYDAIGLMIEWRFDRQ